MPEMGSARQSFSALIWYVGVFGTVALSGVTRNKPDPILQEVKSRVHLASLGDDRQVRKTACTPPFHQVRTCNRLKNTGTGPRPVLNKVKSEPEVLNCMNPSLCKESQTRKLIKQQQSRHFLVYFSCHYGQLGSQIILQPRFRAKFFC